MEIIKNNFIPDTEELIHVQCSHCNSILKCTTEELKNNRCPCCGESLSKKNMTTCEHCGRQFTYNTEDCTIEQYGLYFTDCPYCHHHTAIDDGIDVTVENLKEEYFSKGSKVNGVAIDFSEIKKRIQDGVAYLKESEDNMYYYISTGNSFILVTKDDNMYYVMYTDDYKDVYLKE